MVKYFKVLSPVAALLAALAWTVHAHVGSPYTFLELGTKPMEAEDHGAHHEAHGEEESHPVVGHAEHTDKHVAKHVEHGTKAHGTGVNGGCPGNQSANSVAVGLMAGVILMPLVVYMTMTKAAKGAVSDLTFRMIDLSTSIFLAVLWFSASADVLEYEVIRKAFPYSEEVFAAVQVILLYVITMCIAYHFRENKYYLLTFCGCAGHYIAFAAIKATGESQHIAGGLAPEGMAPAATFGFCFVVFALWAGMSLICFMGWRRYIKDEELHLAVEELELDIVGLVMSFAIMQAFRHFLTGHYPAQAHLFLQQQLGALSNEVALSGCSSDSGPHLQHTSGQRIFMLLFAIGLTVLCAATLHILEDAKSKSKYWGYKAFHIVQVILVMCVAWSWLLWGEWQFYETFFHGDKMFGKMVFAVIATFVCLVLITSVAFATAERFSNSKGYADLIVMAASLVTAWSWEHCFHTAINVIADQYQVGYGGLVPKLVVALAIPLFILPGYIVFLKPIVLEVEERVHGAESMATNARLSEVLYTGPGAARDSPRTTLYAEQGAAVTT